VRPLIGVFYSGSIREIVVHSRKNGDGAVGFYPHWFNEEPKKLANYLNAELKKNEAYYQEILCNDLDGIIEYRLPDRSRVDCLTFEYAIEVDFDKKPYECAAQALYYAIMTNRKPACAFITDKKESTQINKLEVLAKAYNIKIIYIDK